MAGSNRRSETMPRSDAWPAGGVHGARKGIGLPSARDLAGFAGLTIAYWLLASYGLQWANVAGAGSPVWPAAGIAIVGLALGGVRLWPAIAIGRMLTAWTIG